MYDRYVGGAEEADLGSLVAFAAYAAADVDGVAVERVEAAGADGAGNAREGDKRAQQRQHDLTAVGVTGNHEVDAR
jgi:hypothetical protein